MTITEVVLNPSLTDTPARVNMRTGVMEVSEGFFSLPKEFQVFIICHEYGHRLADTRDEHLADEIAFRLYANLGYPLSKSVMALANILNKDSAFHVSRAKAVLDLAQNFDNQVFKPYTGYKDLTKMEERKAIIRKQRNEKMKEISRLIANKQYSAAQKCIADQVRLTKPGSKMEKAYTQLGRLVSKAATCENLPSGQSQKGLRQLVDNKFRNEEHFKAFTDELEGFADELQDIAAFNDTFDAYVGEMAEVLDVAAFSENEDIQNFMNCDHAMVSNFAGDVEEFYGEESATENPFFVNATGNRKAKRDERKASRDERRNKRSDNKAKIADAKAQKIVAKGKATEIRANAKQTLANQGKGGFQLDPSVLDKGLDALGKVANAATGGAGDIVGKLLGAPQENPDAGLVPVNGTPETKLPDEKKGLPMWAWIAIGVAVVAAIGGGIWYLTKKK